MLDDGDSFKVLFPGRPLHGNASTKEIDVVVQKLSPAVIQYLWFNISLNAITRHYTPRALVSCRRMDAIETKTRFDGWNC